MSVAWITRYRVVAILPMRFALAAELASVARSGKDAELARFFDHIEITTAYLVAVPHKIALLTSLPFVAASGACSHEASFAVPLSRLRSGGSTVGKHNEFKNTISLSRAGGALVSNCGIAEFSDGCQDANMNVRCAGRRGPGLDAEWLLGLESRVHLGQANVVNRLHW